MEVGSSSLPGTTLRRKAMCTRHVKLPGTNFSRNGGLAQLARAPALQAGGQRFESVILHSPENRIGAANPKPDTRRALFWKRSLTY